MLSRNLGHMDCGVYAEVIADGDIGLGDAVTMEQPTLV
jgi:MOSC domain-containing protein YiiM